MLQLYVQLWVLLVLRYLGGVQAMPGNIRAQLRRLEDLIARAKSRDVISQLLDETQHLGPEDQQMILREAKKSRRRSQVSTRSQFIHEAQTYTTHASRIIFCEFLLLIAESCCPSFY